MAENVNLKDSNSKLSEENLEITTSLENLKISDENSKLLEKSSTNEEIFTLSAKVATLTEENEKLC